MDSKTKPLPAPLAGIIGATEFNEKLVKTADKFQLASRNLERTLERLNKDDIAGSLNAKSEYARAEAEYNRACDTLEAERKKRLHTQTGKPVDFDYKPLLIAETVTGAKEYNSKVCEFGRRMFKALLKPDNARGLALLAWAADPTDAALLKWNLAIEAEQKAAIPFNRERDRILSIRNILINGKGTK